MAKATGSEPGNFKIVWNSAGRTAQCPSDPKYPRGIHIDGRIDKAEPSCFVKLPYPAECVGGYRATCNICGLVIGITAAGRPDDPKSFEITCNLHGTKQ
jgi:hypothetical protein